MKPVLIVFGTRHGTTRKIAGRLAERLAGRHVPVKVIDAAAAPRELELDDHAGAIVVASVHVGKHEPEVLAFARTHRAALERLPTVFLSVSLSAAVADDALALPERRAVAHADVLGMLAAFVGETGWQPRRMEAVAGGLPYTRYPFVLRQVMRLIAWRAGAPTDASRDHELTDWKAVERVADTFAARFVEGPRTLPFARGPEPVAIWN